MECPKCNFEVDEKALICPNCKKVLKLVCPKCNTVNKANTCKKCGFVIITKCHQCGRVNQTINETCSKCGFSTYTSVAINSSNIDEFACLTIEFPNLADLKAVLGSIKLTDKFKANLDKLILNYTNLAGISREIIENVYVVRFNKDGSFATSAKNAVKAAIEIQNLITELNFKLYNAKNTLLQCNMAVLKRDIYSKPSEYKSGFDIKLIYNNPNELRLINCLQVITDSYIYEQVCDDFDLSTLTANFVKNEMMTFFELNLKKYIKIPKPPDENADEAEVQNLAKLNVLDVDALEKEDEKNELYETNAINFNDLRCTFTKVKSLNLIPSIVNIFKQHKKKIVSVKGEKEFLPRTGKLLHQLENLNVFKNIYRVTCHDGIKYKPYGFFHELILGMYNFSISPKNFSNHKFEMFKEMDPSEFLKSLINLTERDFPHPEDVRYSLFDIFLEIFRSMSDSLIYIENFEKIDDTSLEVLQLLFENFNDLNISYLITTNKASSLHKKSHFLLTDPNYIEISSSYTPFKEMIGLDVKRFEKVLDSYYMIKVAQNTKGSVLYFRNAIDYLLEKKLLTVENGCFAVANYENILIPASLDDLIKKRLKILAKDKEVYRLLGLCLLIGPMIDLQTVRLFNIPNIQDLIKKLTALNYIYVYNNTVYIQNYNLYKENFISATPSDLKEVIADELLTIVFSSEIKHPAETVLYKILEQEKQEFIAWEKLSRLNASLGDFSAYLNCSVKFLKLLDRHVDEDSQKTIEEYKMEVYENISNLLYKYTPNEIYNITQTVLNNLEGMTDEKKVINLYNKMLQGCFIGGNYSYALDLIYKILSKFSDASINPADNNFNIKYFLISLVKIEVLFSIGNLKDCVESGEEILEVISSKNLSKLKPENLSEKEFEKVILDAMSFVAISKIMLLQDDLNDFITKVRNNVKHSDKKFDLFFDLEKVVRGIRVEHPQNASENDKFSKIIASIVKAFNDGLDDYTKFADSIYQAKLHAKAQKLSQIELICDLLIGYSYFKLNQHKKASSIYYNVLETSTKNGLKFVTYLDWYFMSVLKFEQQDIEVAFGIANNAAIQLEKDHNAGDFIFFLFRILLSKILIAKNDTKSAELCLNDAKFIKDRYGLNFALATLNTEVAKLEDKSTEKIK